MWLWRCDVVVVDNRRSCVVAAKMMVVGVVSDANSNV